MQPFLPQGNDPASRARQAAHAAVNSLHNPYGYSSHYAQAYYSQQQHQQFAGSIGTSSWHSNPMSSTSFYPHTAESVTSSHLPSLPPRPAGTLRQSQMQNQAHWYEPGPHRCTYEGCTFQGSKKSLEIHKMDRHLIYPPDWHKRKRRPDWDADPSLNNGKPLPIQGTSILLDSQDKIDAWLAERRKRWPSAATVQEKEQKYKEAVDRGELFPSETLSKKRRRPQDERSRDLTNNSRGRGRDVGAGRGGHAIPRIVHPLPMKPVFISPSRGDLPGDDGDGSDTSSGSDIDPVKDAMSSKRPIEPLPGVIEKGACSKDSPVLLEKVASMSGKQKGSENNAPKDPQRTTKPFIPKLPPKPRPAPQNPFANRSSLLRNLLLPEIRMTVSNLSQAIHFLVQNDFLRNVELNPGDADEKMIEMLGDDKATDSRSETSR